MKIVKTKPASFFDRCLQSLLWYPVSLQGSTTALICYQKGNFIILLKVKQMIIDYKSHNSTNSELIHAQTIKTQGNIVYPWKIPGFERYWI